MKTNVYVDGFNLFYGIRDHGQSRWLDLSKLCRLLLPGDSINRIRYFTARISPWPKDPDKRLRQQTYLRALQTIPNLTIHEGHFISKPARMWLVNPPRQGPNTAEVIRTEEKGSDVNLATHMLLDTFDGDCEMAVVISNDSDLAFPISVVRNRFRLPVGVLNPHRNASRTLQRVASFYRPIRAGAVRSCQFPTSLSDKRGLITKPIGW